MELKKITKSFGEHPIFQNLNLTFPEHTITGLSGPSGIGKTTLLRIIAGLESADSGEIIGKTDNGISFVFQENRLLPWMTVCENISFVLKTEREKAGIPRMLELLELKALANRYPDALSGGQQHRVALARAFCADHDLLLMDEPFTGLDKELKERIISAFMALWQKKKTTVIIASHDQSVLEQMCHHVIHFDHLVGI